MALDPPPHRALGLPLLLSVVLAAPLARAQIVIGPQPLLLTVGSDAACTHSTLATALSMTAANAGPDSIRVAKNHTDTSIAVQIVDQQVTVEGGFDDCGDGSASGQTTLDGSGGSAASVIEIATKPAGGEPGPDVLLRNLVIEGGEDDADGGDLGGGGLDISGGMDVRLEGVTVRNNSSTRGGGILVRGGGSSVVIAEGSRVGGGNTADAGGGIFCTGFAFAGLVDSRVAGNRAELGGGAFATASCLLRILPGGVGEGVISNDAGAGGGIYASGGARVELLGDETHPARIASNRATDGLTRRGGGIWVTGPGTEVIAENAHIASNTADRSSFGGAGAFVDEGAYFRMGRTLGADCHTADRCSSLSGNFGGALAVTTGSTAELHGTYVEDNAPLDAREPIFAIGGTLSVEGVVVAGNGPGLVLETGNGSDTHLSFATFADNVLGDEANTLLANSGDLALHSSILAEPTADLLAQFGAATADLDCLIVNDDSMLPAGTRIVERDLRPFFVDPDAGDYHLLATPLNLAIDFCDDSVAAPAFGDIDGEPRGMDAPGVGEAFPGGFWDLGADEAQLVPEPGAPALGLAAMGALVALGRRRIAPRSG